MACQRCHRKKVKCSGGDSARNLPCRHCRSARAQCIYPTRQRNVTISESYLRALESAVAQLNDPARVEPPALPEAIPSPRQNTQGASSKRHFIENTTGDAFVVRLRNLGSNKPSSAWIEGDDGNATVADSLEHDSVPPYEYFSLPSDGQASNVTLKLPPYPYAIHLVNQFETYMGYEYHWYLRKSFRMRLDATYTDPHSEHSKDRTWLCRLLVVLALGETYNSRVAPWIDLRRDRDTAQPRSQSPINCPPPGVEFFEQAMSLFKTPFEEATVDHVEVLNLMAFYSYSLNRRRSAYVYSGLAIRIAASLMLQNPSACKFSSRCESEHRKRLWWTTYQLDAMTGSEMGLNSTYDFEEIEAKLGLPSDDGLSGEDQGEFANCTILTSHIRLCSVRTGILSVVGTGLLDADSGQVEVTLREPIRILEEWREQLPGIIDFDFSNGIPPDMIAMPECRSLASLYLRFHQCFILLIRPVLLRLLAASITRHSNELDRPAFVNLSNCCVDSARQNLNILDSLRKIDRIAKFGYWESLHLFSSIKIFLMASIIGTLQPFSVVYNHVDDDTIYRRSKLLLHEMATAGNMTSRGHCNLLEELERTRELVAGRVGSNAVEGMVLPDPDIDIDQWLAMLSGSPNMTSMLPV